MDAEHDADRAEQEHEQHAENGGAEEDSGKIDEKKDTKKGKRTWSKVDAKEYYNPVPYAAQKGASSGKGKGKGKGDRDDRDGAAKGRGKGGGYDRYSGGDRSGDRNATERGPDAEPARRTEEETGEAPAPRPQGPTVQPAPGPVSPPPPNNETAAEATEAQATATTGFRGTIGHNIGPNASPGGAKSRKSGGKPGRDMGGKGFNPMSGKGPGNFGGKAGGGERGAAGAGACGAGGCGGCGGCGGPSSGACGAGGCGGCGGFGGGCMGGPRGGGGGKGGAHKGANSGMGGPGIGQRGAAGAAPPVQPSAGEPEAAVGKEHLEGSRAPVPSQMPARSPISPNRGAAALPGAMAPMPMPIAYGAMPGAFRGMPFAPMGMAPYAYDGSMPYPMAAYPYAGQMPAFFVMPTGQMGAAPPYMAAQHLAPMGMMPASADRASLKEQVRAQIEYYFGQENLIKDVHLRRNCMDHEGWVRIATLAGFRRVQNMTMDLSIIMEALQEIPTLELDAGRQNLRLKDGWQRWVIPEAAGDVDGKRP